MAQNNMFGGRRRMRGASVPENLGVNPIQPDAQKPDIPTGEVRSRRSFMGGPSTLAVIGATLRQLDGGNELDDYLSGQRDQQYQRDMFGLRAAQGKREDAETERTRQERLAAMAALPENLRPFGASAIEPFVRSQVPLSEEDRAANDLRERQFDETVRHNRTSEGIDWARANREGQNGIPTLAEARQWTNSYNDDVRQTLGDLGNMRTAIPYAQQVVRNNGANTGNFRMNDVALLRAAARAQTGPGVLTESEVFGTLSPSLQQDLVRARSYTDISQAGISPQDRLALAQYVQESARNTSGDLWRRYSDAENVLRSRGIDPANVGISAPEYAHPEDMDSFMSQPLERFSTGRNYVAPSGRQYEYLGDGRFRYSGRNRYDRSLRVDRPRGDSGADNANQTGVNRPRGNIRGASDQPRRIRLD